MTLKDQIASVGNIQDLARVIGPKIDHDIFKIVVESYRMLYSRNVVNENWEENQITLHLCKCISERWNESYLRKILYFIHQYPVYPKPHNIGGAPTIDFVFDKGFEKICYFAFECKLLKENENRRYLLYVTEGVQRFTEGKYSSETFAGSMIGYISSGETSKVILRVKEKVDLESNIISEMKVSFPINNFIEHYKSIHIWKSGISPFHLHHIFFTFT